MPNPAFRKTLIIGLGGAGRLAVLHVKRQFLDTYGVLPPCIKLFCLDTDRSSVSLRSEESEREYSLDPNEFMYIPVSQTAKFIAESAAVSQWYILPISAGAMHSGAGAIRQNGRVALFYHLNEVRGRLDTILNTQLQSAVLPLDMERTTASDGQPTTGFTLLEGATEIYVCGSVCGGTGAGIFLDIGILLRHMVPEALIHGFFLLNWVYRNKAWAYRVHGNAYAALEELDYLENVQAGGRDAYYEVQYADQTIRVTAPPYTLFHVIDGKKENGQTVDNVAALCDTLAKAIFLSCSSMGEAVGSVVDNLLRVVYAGVGPRVWKGRPARYSSFGLSSLYYPGRELHRLCAARTAHTLCERALAEVIGGPDEEARRTANAARIGPDVDDFFRRPILLSRENIQKEICPARPQPALNATKWLIAHPDDLTQALAAEESAQERLLDQAFLTMGQVFTDSVQEAFALKTSELERDATLDDAYRRQWLDAAIYQLEKQSGSVAKDIAGLTEDVSKLRATVQEQQQRACEAFYMPVLGGSRKSAVESCVGTALDLLSKLCQLKTSTKEQEFYRQALATLRTRGPATRVSDTNVIKVLRASEARLRQALQVQTDNIQLLRNRPDQVLIGNGNTVVVPGELADTLREDKIALDFAEFKRDRGIHNPQDYFSRHQQAPDELDGLFLDYCREKLAHLTTVGVKDAIETIGRVSGDANAFMTRQFDHLFRLASPLWSYSHAQLTELRQLTYDRVVSLGVHDGAVGRSDFDRHVETVKGRHGVQKEHSYSTTRDPHRIWLLSFAAALPMYLIGDLREHKSRYEEEISPSYHVDSWLEMNVPDLSPEGTFDNVALRVLAMAIVSGIDLVHDEKLLRGHKFTSIAPEVTALNDGEPKLWLLFRAMYDEVKGEGAEREGSLLSVLTALLRERVALMDRDRLKGLIEAHINRFRTKMAKRDFSRVISARLTYREITELEAFLAPKSRRGYGMDIEQYIAGR